VTLTATEPAPEAKLEPPQRFLIRPFRPEDYEYIAVVRGISLPEYPMTADEWRFEDEKRDPKFLHARFVAEDPDEGVIGFAQYGQDAWNYDPRRFDLRVVVTPAHRRRGVGAALYDHLLAELNPLDPTGLRAQVREDMADALSFVQRRGYVETMRDWESRLDVPACDLSRFDGAAERVAAQGIVVRTLRELDGDPDRDRRLWELECAVSLDMPSADESTTPDFEDWRRHTFETPNLRPDGYFVAVDTTAGDRYVGVSQLWGSPSVPDLFTGATGVLREYRRRGIALAMKLRAVTYARESGAPVIRTWNAQSNRAMLSINEALGFAKQPAWIAFAKNLGEEGGGK
jgi:GNAT superfamily N-acetyltransferase